MAYIRCDFKSEELEMNTSMVVILPENRELNQVPVVYLLHGLSDNCSGWTRYTSIERYAREHSVAVVMPEVQRSFYSDMKYGLAYFKFIQQELPQICHRFFGLSLSPSLNYIMGLSMGGYATLKCVLNKPESYAGAAAFSSVIDMEKSIQINKDNHRFYEYKAMFGEELVVPENSNLIKLVKKVEPKAFPKLYMACGEQDELYSDNVRMEQLLTESNIKVNFQHWSGNHSWEFWDQAVKKAFEYMFQ